MVDKKFGISNRIKRFKFKVREEYEESKFFYLLFYVSNLFVFYGDFIIG